MLPLPKISVITPSYNQGEFIEETILSVLEQDYPNIEYIVIDGGSSDNTVEVLKKYEHKIAYWISERDNGQPHAINKGLKRITGDIIAFINSDDYYEPGVFKKVANEFLKGNKWIVGSVRNFRTENKQEDIIQQKCNSQLFDWLVRNNQNHQPGNFWSKKIVDEVGLMNEKLQYAFDWDYWVRFIVKGFKPAVFNNDVYAHFRLHNESKTVKLWRKFNAEFVEIMNEYKIFLSKENASKVDAAIKKILSGDKIHEAVIESINGKFKAAASGYKEAFQIRPSLILKPYFLFGIFKALIYMPVRKKFTNAARLL